jgi:hypothetical protein
VDRHRSREWALLEVEAELYRRDRFLSTDLAKSAAARAGLPSGLVSDRDIAEAADRAARSLSSIDFGADRVPTRKSVGTVPWSVTAEILKTDAAQRLVTGIVLEPTDVVGADTQNDIYSAETIALAADQYMLTSQVIGIQHAERAGERVRVVRSWIAANDETINGQRVVKGSWLMTVKVFDDDLWNQVLSGVLSGFSVGGVATRTRISA